MNCSVIYLFCITGILRFRVSIGIAGPLKAGKIGGRDVSGTARRDNQWGLVSSSAGFIDIHTHIMTRRFRGIACSRARAGMA